MAKFKDNTIISKDMDKFIKKSSENAGIPYIQIILDEDLINYPNNDEDLTDTADLENSIKEVGFTDPIEVLKMDNDKYMILSGHRRRLAGVKAGLKEFPCIVIPSLKTDNEIHNYVLLANSHRDSSKDPLLYCKRYKMHEAYLKASGFKGAKREEIAKRLGISLTQADRYNRFNQIIAPIWELVRKESVGMSSVLLMYTLPTEEQEEIYQIFLRVLEKEERINRETCELIIKKYRDKENPENIVHNVTNAPITSVDIIYSTADTSGENEKNDDENDDDDADEDAADEDAEDEKDDDTYNDAAEEAAATIQNFPPSLAHSLNNANNTTQANSTRRVDEADNILGKKLEKSLEKIASYMDSNDYKFSDEKTAKATIGSMLDIVSVMVTAIQDLAKKYNAGEYVTDLKSVIKSLLEQ